MNAQPLREVIANQLSVLICTRNRASLLSQALGSFANVRIPQGWSVELIVVDNGSTDGTSAVITSFNGKLPFPVRCVVEPKPGLGQAHAAGLDHCAGEIIACTDDDCMVSESWCEAIVAVFAANSDLGGLFGRVVSYEDRKESVWRVAVKTKEERTVHRYPCWPIIGFGNNMAFRRTALESVGGFNPLFGPGGKLWSSEELEVAYRILRSGWAVSYEPSVQLWHRARTEFNAWQKTHQRDALGIGAFSGSYGIRGDAYAWKFAWWNWSGMAKSWLQGLFGGDLQKRQVGGWYVWQLPLGLLAGIWNGFWKNPKPPLRGAFVIRPPKSSVPAEPLASVIICTRNRAPMIKEALESVLLSEGMAAGQYEAVIVDNGSCDATGAFILSIQQKSAVAVTYAYEPRKGVCRAKNVALQLARGKVLAFIDDDCLVDGHWLRSIVDIFQKDTELSGFCGRVLPYGGVIDSSVVSVKTTETPQRFHYPCSPFVGHGNNMAFFSQKLKDIGGFDVMLGPGGPMCSADEFDVFYRLLRRGDTLSYEPRPFVYHRSRLTQGEAESAEWRNAIGVGAALSKHLFHGDIFALKCAYWLAGSLQSTAVRAWRLGGPRQDFKRSLIYCLGMPYGMMRWLGYMLGGRKAAS